MSITDQLAALGLENIGEVALDLSTPQLSEEIIKNREGRFAHLGALVVRTGHFAERSPRDFFVVKRPKFEALPWAPGLFRSMAPETFEELFSRVRTYLHNRDLYVQDVFAAGSSAERRVPLRFVTEMAWHSLFVRTLLWPRQEVGATIGEAPFTVVHVPRFQAVPERDGTSGSTFAAIDPEARVAVIGGTAYAGELRAMTASICHLCHAELPLLPLRCAVSVGPEGDVAAFLGRTGNGKTELALDAGRTLIGDHDQGWDDQGLFAYERGCYARTFGLDPELSPTLHQCTRRFGAVLENVTLDHRSRRVDFKDQRLTTNTRAAFPGSHLPGYDRSARCGHPKHLFLLTRDTLGVLPPIARMTPDQAVFSFLTGYVASLVETEARPGDIRPSAQAGPVIRFPAGALRPEVYAKRFLERITRHGGQCWFMNTGWVGEPMGRAERFDLGVSKALVRAALAGQLDDVPYEKDPLFLFEVPKACPGVDAALLDPRGQAADQGDYELRANRLALDFIEGFKRFEVDMPESVREMVASVPLLDTDLDIMDQVGFSI